MAATWRALRGAKPALLHIHHVWPAADRYLSWLAEAAGVLWCDGRRTVDLPPGARIEVRRGERPVRLVRLHEAPFTDRLVAKFGLSVEGWRGASERRMRGADGA